MKFIPPELLTVLKTARQEKKSEFVVTGPGGEMVSYEWYCRTLKRYCRELGLPTIGTHGLRHSTSSVYQSHGASKDDLKNLFAHSDFSVTERYTHGEGDHLQKVSQQIRLFADQPLPGGVSPTCSHNVPISSTKLEVENRLTSLTIEGYKDFHNTRA